VRLRLRRAAYAQAATRVAAAPCDARAFAREKDIGLQRRSVRTSRKKTLPRVERLLSTTRFSWVRHAQAWQATGRLPAHTPICGCTSLGRFLTYEPPPPPRALRCRTAPPMVRALRCRTQGVALRCDSDSAARLRPKRPPEWPPLRATPERAHEKSNRCATPERTHDKKTSACDAGACARAGGWVPGRRLPDGPSNGGSVHLPLPSIFHRSTSRKAFNPGLDRVSIHVSLPSMFHRHEQRGDTGSGVVWTYLPIHVPPS
jgi:hypothetical protein